MAIAFLAPISSGFTGPGSGTTSDPYKISNLSELNQTRNDLSAHYKLVSDINATETQEWDDGKGWKPIGGDNNRFSGKFNGSFHSIENLTIDRPNTDYQGLFGSLDYGGLISNVAVKKANITGQQYVGGVVGYNYETVKQSTVTGTINGYTMVGGLVGVNEGFISKSYTRTEVNGRYSVGGLIGEAEYGDAGQAYATGDTSGENNVGGIIGDSSSYAYHVHTYWDKKTTGQQSSADGTGLQTWEFSNKSKLSGFNFSNTWEFAGGTNDGYPVLKDFNRTERPPNASLLIPQIPNTQENEFITGEDISFYNNLSGANNFEWNLGDGTTVNKENFNHSYSSSGDYQVTMNASNSEGWDTASKQIKISHWPCTSGSLDTECTINETIPNVKDRTTISGDGDLIIGSNGSLTTKKRDTINVSFEGDVTIRKGGLINGNVNISAKNLRIDEGGLINATGKGYRLSNGPMSGNNGYNGGSGAGHGGSGGTSVDNYSPGIEYGSTKNPTSFGSGGGSSGNPDGGAGGGRVIINVTDLVTLNGDISSSGVPGKVQDYSCWSCGGGAGGGAGGSINLYSEKLTGTGNMTANGGDGEYGGGGGAGGRIAAHSNITEYKGIGLVQGGEASNYDSEPGAGGTLYPTGLICDHKTPESTCEITSEHDLNSPLKGEKLIVKSGGVLNKKEFREELYLNFSTVKIASGGLISASLDLDVENLTVESKGKIDASGLGYQDSEGPGGSLDGGSYGGTGGTSPYGSLYEPESFGSGGDSYIYNGAAGGGHISINATNEAVINGDIKSDGREKELRCCGEGGSGGSINILTSDIRGDGLLSSSGGSNNETSSGIGGSGGRIAIQSSKDNFNGKINLTGKGYAGNGTLYRKKDIRTYKDNQPSLETYLNKSSNGTNLIKNINHNWTRRYLNWTDNISKTSKYSENWGGKTEAQYNINSLAENLEFKVLKDGKVIKQEKSGATGSFKTINTFERVSSNASSNVGGTSNQDPAMKNNNFVPEKDILISGVQLYSESPRTISFNIKNNDNGKTIIDSSYSHEGSKWETKPIEEFIAFQNTTYKFTADTGYYGTKYGDYETTDSGITWSDGNGIDPWTMGLLVSEGLVLEVNSSGYLPNSTYSSTVIDSGGVREWSEVVIDDELPYQTDYNISFSENSSGEWTYYDEFRSLPNSRYLKYNVSMSTENSSRTPKIKQIRFGYDTASRNGSISFSTNLTEAHTFEVLESIAPKYSDISQNQSLIGVNQSNRLSLNVSDIGSGLSTAKLATNESGTWKNRSKYFKNLDNSSNGTKISFNWLNDSFDGKSEDVSWRIHISDSAANWNSTPIKTFTVDGKKPASSNISYNSNVDIDYGSTEVSVDIFDSTSGVDSVIIGENSTGIFTNSSMSEDSSTYSQTISSSTPKQVDFRIYANDTSGNLKTIKKSVQFENITFNLKTEERVNPVKGFIINGSAALLPSGKNVNGTLKTRIESKWFNKSFSDGNFSISVEAPQTLGNKTLNTTVENNNGVKGFNSTSVTVLNLSNTIQSVKDNSGSDTNVVYKDDDSNYDLEFVDNASADTSNNVVLEGVNSVYSIPSEWAYKSKDETSSDLSPGEWTQNNPKLDVGKNAELGKHNITLTSSSENDIKSEFTEEIEVWTQSEASFRNKPSTINRNKDYYQIYADVEDYANSSSLNNISTKFNVGGGPTVTVESNESGIAEFNWSIEDYSTGSYTLSLKTKNEASRYINSSGNIKNLFVEIQGVMSLSSYSEGNDPVYRLNDSSDSSTFLTPTITDSQNNLLDNVNVSFNISDTYLDCQTSSGSCSVNYNPEDEIKPGSYKARINATNPPDFDPLRFNETLEIRGISDIEQDISRTIYNRGISYDLNSTVTDGLDDTIYGNTTWKLNDNNIAEGEDVEWAPSVSTSRGVKNLNASTDRRYYDDSFDSRSIEVYGFADLESLYPSSSTILPDTKINVTAEVIDSNTSSQIEDMPVTFKINGTEKTKAETNSSGIAGFKWMPSKGAYNLTAHISDNASIRYNVSKNMLQSTVRIDKETVLDSFSKSNKDVFRNDIKNKDTTTFSANLSEASKKDTRAPANDISVIFEVDNTENVTCKTDSLGYCTVDYNPSSSVSVGEVSVDITTNRTDWENVNETSSLVVKGLLAASIDKPSSSILYRGDTVSLEATTTSGGEKVDVPVTWRYRGSKIAIGKDTTWNVSDTKTIGSGILEIEAGGNIYQSGTDSVNKLIYARSDVGLTQPDNSSDMGYAETPTVKCIVRNNNGIGIDDYPVEFVQNGTVFESKMTDSNGEVSTTWNIPNSISTYEMGCRIEDNSTLNYNTSDKLEYKLYDTKDNVNPLVENTSVRPTTVDPGDKVDLKFDASDKVAVDETWILIKKPNGVLTDKKLASEEVGNTYSYEFDKTSNKGTYGVRFKANDTSGNIGKKRDSFTVDPGGKIALSETSKSLDSIKQNSGSSFKVEVNLTVDESTNYTNITSSMTDTTKLTVNTSRYDCGNLSEGESCTKTFNTSVEPGSNPSTEYVTFDGEWRNSGDNSLVSKFTEINIVENPVLEVETANKTPGIVHGNSDTFGFKVNSTGNYRVENYNSYQNGGNLSSKWLSLTDDAESKLVPMETQITDVRISIPEGQSPGSYIANLIFDSDNGGSEVRDIDVNVPPDPDYNVPSTVDISTVQGKTGDLENVTVENIGNVDLVLDSNLSGEAGNLISAESIESTKQAKENLLLETATADGFPSPTQYDAELTLKNSNLSYGTLEENIDLNIDVLDFSIGFKTPESIIEKQPSNYSTVKYNVTLAGSKREENITHRIYINGTNTEINSISNNSGVYTANITVPEIPDARKHDLNVEVTDTENNVTTNNVISDRFEVPDVTKPVFGEIEVKGTSLGENSSIMVEASDNNLNGIANLSVEIPSENKTVYPTKNSANWTSKINVTSSGKYKALIKADDPEGNTEETVERFRIANKTNLSTNVSKWGDKPDSVNMTFKDSYTSEEVANVNSRNGNISVNNISEGSYDVNIDYKDYNAVLRNTNIEENTTSIVKMDDISAVNAPSPKAEHTVKGLGVETQTSIESSQITLSYPSNGDFSVNDLKVARCPEYDYQNIDCKGNFEIYDLNEDNIDRSENEITINVTGFSSYTLFEPFESNTQDDNNDDTGETTPSPTGGGGGGGAPPSDSISQEELDESLDDLENSLSESESESVKFSSNSITARIKPGESQRTSISIENTLDVSQTFNFEASEIISEYVSEPDSATLEPGESTEVTVNINASASETPDSYSGYMSVESDSVSAEIPTNVNVLPPNDELLDLSVTPVFDSVAPGETMKIETTLNNQGYARNVDVAVKVELVDSKTNETLATKETTYAVGTTLTRVVDLKIPQKVERKQYEVRSTARYTNLDVPRVANAITTAKVATPFWDRNVFGLKYSTLGLTSLAFVLMSLGGYGLYQYRRKKILEKKRYLENIDLDTIPSGGDRQAYLGKLAEIGKRTFINIDDLKTHALVAGSTGSGKTVTGQVMVEEALDQGANVIVLDPTAQWTGFLRENKDSAMLQLLQDYGMSAGDAKAFDGNIRAVEPDEKNIDIKPYLEENEEGNIIVFSLHKLDSKTIDQFVDNTIQQVFDANLPERDHLETLVVYDEVHRLLEKFGGSGKGLKQLERGAREFRKWGIGMILLSQVISDFSGEIRANIGTTVQMRTQYDDDLERMKDKFGIDTVKSIAKAEQGSGMLENSDYNHGRPYFVDFRPPKHSPHRLVDEDLDKYEEYNREIDRLESKVDGLEEAGEDVYEQRNKIKLAKRNLRKGSFSLIEIYIDELEEDIQK